MKSVHTQIILYKGYVKLNLKHTSETLKGKIYRKNRILLKCYIIHVISNI